MSANLKLRGVRRLGLTICAAMAFAVGAMVANDASAQSKGRWDNLYLPKKGAGTVSVCIARRQYSNGYFLMRVSEGMNTVFMFKNTDLGLPPSRKLGTVRLVFKGRSYYTQGRSVKARSGAQRVSALFLTPSKRDTVEIVKSLKVASQLAVRFPDGTSYRIDLNGSSAAIDRAIQCYYRNIDRRGGRNPFQGSGSSGSSGSSGKRNPFGGGSSSSL